LDDAMMETDEIAGNGGQVPRRVRPEQCAVPLRRGV